MGQKQELLKLLDALDVKYEIILHPAIFTINEMESLNLPNSSAVAKNLFIRDDKKQNYYLFAVRKEKRVDLKELEEKIGSRRLSFASEKDLSRFLGLAKGAVTPFGIVNDTGRRVKVYLDADFEHGLIGVHPNENTATVWLKTADLVGFIKQRGNPAEFIDF